MPEGERRSADGVSASTLDWEAHKSHIRDLYLCQNLSVKSVAKMMKERYGFKASERMYKSRITSWKFNKRVKAREREEIIHEWNRRRLQGEHCPVIFVHGRRIDQHKIDRYLRDQVKAVAAPPLQQRRDLTRGAYGVSSHNTAAPDQICYGISARHWRSEEALDIRSNGQSPEQGVEDPKNGSKRSAGDARRIESRPSPLFTHSDESTATLFQGCVADCRKIPDSSNEKIASDVSSSANSPVLCSDLGLPNVSYEDAPLAQLSITEDYQVRPQVPNGQSNFEDADFESNSSNGSGISLAHAAFPSSSHCEPGDAGKWIARCTLAAATDVKHKAEARAALLESAATHFRALLANHDPGLLTAFVVLGAILEAKGMDVEIGEVLQHADHACTTFLGVDNPITTTVRWMTSILSKEREPLRISPCRLRDICDRFRQEYGSEHPYYLTSLYNLAKLLDLEKYPSESVPMLRTLNDVCPRVFGAGHVQTIMVQMTLSRLLLDVGEMGEAERLVATAVNGAQSSERCTPGHEDPYALECLRRQALLLERVGKDHQIEAILRRVLRGRILSLGILHKYTQGSKDDLESWLEIQGCPNRIPELREEIAKWAEQAQQSEQAR